jgi:hypothetical protein
MLLSTVDRRLWTLLNPHTNSLCGAVNRELLTVNPSSKLIRQKFTHIPAIAMNLANHG